MTALEEKRLQIIESRDRYREDVSLEKLETMQWYEQQLAELIASQDTSAGRIELRLKLAGLR